MNDPMAGKEIITFGYGALQTVGSASLPTGTLVKDSATGATFYVAPGGVLMPAAASADGFINGVVIAKKHYRVPFWAAWEWNAMYSDPARTITILQYFLPYKLD